MEGETEAQEKERLAQGQRLESDEPGLDSLTQAPRHLCVGFTPSLFPLKAGPSSRLVGPYLLQGPFPGVCSPRGPALLEGAPPPHHLPVLLRNSLTGANLDTPVPLTGYWALGDVLGVRCCVTQNKPPALSGPRGVF